MTYPGMPNHVEQYRTGFQSTTGNPIGHSPDELTDMPASHTPEKETSMTAPTTNTTTGGPQVGTVPSRRSPVVTVLMVIGLLGVLVIMWHLLTPDASANADADSTVSANVAASDETFSFEEPLSPVDSFADSYGSIDDQTVTPAEPIVHTERVTICEVRLGNTIDRVDLVFANHDYVTVPHALATAEMLPTGITTIELILKFEDGQVVGVDTLMDVHSNGYSGCAYYANEASLKGGPRYGA